MRGIVGIEKNAWKTRLNDINTTEGTVWYVYSATEDLLAI